jgi:CBS domain-containing protein
MRFRIVTWLMQKEECMRVKAILDEKGRNVLTIGAQATLRDAAKMLHDHHIGAVIVIDKDERITGILAERDIVTAIARYGAESLDKPVVAVMWPNVYRCAEETTIGELMSLMSAKRARHVPVEDNGRLAGIISIGDVVKAHIRMIEREAEEIKAYIAG